MQVYLQQRKLTVRIQ